MGTPAQLPPWWNTQFVHLVSPSVDVSKLDSELVSLLVHAGQVHLCLFNRALEITSGNDGKHVAGSAHFLNKAVDVRAIDLRDEEQAIFSLVLGYFARDFHAAVFDERFTASPHWHIQTADSVGG